MSFFMKLFQIVNILSTKYHIDESHGILHSMQILHYAHDIYENEKHNYPILQCEQQKEIIYIAAILHDMCDKKYMNETEGISEIHNKWNQFFVAELEDEKRGRDEKRGGDENLEIAIKIIKIINIFK